MGDMPAINKDIFYSLIETRDRSPVSYDIIRPMYHGKRGHPVLLHKKTIPVIIAEPDTSEMKNVFLNFRVMDIEMDAVNTFRDVDTPEEYRLISENNGL
jgi:molybdenum cofactor cytidylyltransferase